MRKLGLWVIFLGLSYANAEISKPGEPAKIGVVDMQQAIQSVEDGKKARTQLEAEFNRKKQSLQKEEADLKKAHEEFQKQSLVMTDQARSKKQADLQERFLKLQEQMAKSQSEIQKKEQELTEPIVSKLKKLVNEIATKQGYTLILEKNEHAVLYIQDKDDLTQSVIKSYK